jgi:hypothetical protein
MEGTGRGATARKAVRVSGHRPVPGNRLAPPGARRRRSARRSQEVKLPVILPDLATQQEIADVMTRLEEHEQALRRQLELVGKSVVTL